MINIYNLPYHICLIKISFLSALISFSLWEASVIEWNQTFEISGVASKAISLNGSIFESIITRIFMQVMFRE